MPRAERRQQIMTVAAGCFAARGFAGVTMDEIARHAGVSRLILYRYFADKDDLYREIVVRTAVRLTAALTGAASAALVTSGAPLRAYIAAAREDIPAFSLLFAGATETPSGREIAAARTQVREEIARQALAQAVKEGLVRDTLWLPLAADLTLALVERGTEQWLHTATHPDADEGFVEYLQRAVSGMLSGVAAGRFAFRFPAERLRETP